MSTTYTVKTGAANSPLDSENDSYNGKCKKQLLNKKFTIILKTEQKEIRYYTNDVICGFAI